MAGSSRVLGAAPLIAWMQKEVRSYLRKGSFSRPRFSLIEILLALLILNHRAKLKLFSISIDRFFGALKLSMFNDSLVKFKKQRSLRFPSGAKLLCAYKIESQAYLSLS